MGLPVGAPYCRVSDQQTDGFAYRSYLRALTYILLYADLTHLRHASCYRRWEVREY